MKKDKNKQSKVKGDDRNLVTVDENFPEADIEDKFYMFLQKYRNAIIFVIAVLAISTVGYQTVLYIIAQRDIKRQEEFQESVENNDLSAFIENHSGSKLSGAAYLILANKYYAEKKYSEAAENYKLASETIKESAGFSRARLGYAISIYQQNSVSDPIEALVNDPGILESSRAEAAYTLAVIYLGKGDLVSAEKEVQRIKTFENAGVWEKQAEKLKIKIDNG